ncbi:MAG: ABC transporter substrate-binding protein [Rhodocyclaceae bacterium]|nr:ABC transporter substrate-binding protein [Rhodocyclaceae bacterium]
MVTWRGETAVEKGFRDYFRQHRLTVDFIARDAGRDPARLAAFLDEVPSLKPDLIYTWGTSATLGMVGRHDAPKAASAAIPNVFALVTDPVGAGILTNLSGQKREITGVIHVAPVDDQLAAIRRYRPFSKLGVLYNLKEANSVVVARELRARATAQGFTLLEQTFDQLPSGQPSAEGIASKVRTLAQGGADWLYIGPDSFLFTQIAAVAAAARRESLPTFATTEAVIDAPDDVLAGLVAPYRAVGEFAAHKAAQILFEGRPASQLPVESLKRFSLVVRIDVARKTGLLPPLEFFDFAELRQAGAAP